eukprot:m.7759 g.7759  ORF g.7759 m.7759 type:complete len:168 (+) comp5879_c0_seq1:111-614(+)
MGQKQSQHPGVITVNSSPIKAKSSSVGPLQTPIVEGGDVIVPILEDDKLPSSFDLQVNHQPLAVMSRSLSLYEQDCANAVLSNQVHLKKEIKRVETEMTDAMLKGQRRLQESRRHLERAKQFATLPHEYDVAVDNLKFLLHQLRQANSLLPEQEQVNMPVTLIKYCE